MAEEKKFGKYYYDYISTQASDKPKMSRAEVHEYLKGAHTLERYWSRVEAERAEKQAK